jgi:hypothetical protein
VASLTNHVLVKTGGDQQRLSPTAAKTIDEGFGTGGDELSRVVNVA